jgi:hypothetical protein
MTSNRRAEVEHAVELARKYQLRIAGRGVRKADGAPVWAVTSHSRPGEYHLVALEGERLSCDCYRSARQGKVCSHRGLVHAELANAANERRTSSQVENDPRETAPFLRDNRPLGIFK